MSQMDRFSQFLPDFPCLWNPNDPNFNNETVKEASRRQLLEKCNENREDKLDMPILASLIDILKLVEKTQSETSSIVPPESKDVSEPMSELSESEDEVEIVTENEGANKRTQSETSIASPQSEPLSKFENESELISESENESESMSELSESEDDVEIVTENEGAMKKPTFENLVAEFPCLWDRNDINYRDITVRGRCRNIVLEKCNRYSTVPITTADLNRKLQAMKIRRAKKTKKAPQLKIAESVKSKPTLEDIVSEFPCLWDRNDINYRDITVRGRCRNIVLEKCNRYSTVPITTADLNRKLQAMKIRRERKTKKAPQLKITESVKSKPTLEDIVSEFPCLWDRNDINYRDITVRGRCRNIVLEKCNRYSTVPITTADLNRKLQAMKIRRERKTKKAPQLKIAESVKSKPTLEDIVSEFPCLWDRNDINYRDITVRGRCRNIVLEKFNRYSTVPITMTDLKRKLQAMKIRRARKTKKAPQLKIAESVKSKQTRLADESATDPARILTRDLPQDTAIDSDACQIINESQDSTTPIVLGTVISFDWCRICGEAKKHCVDATSDEKPYIARKKTKLAINDLDIELDFADNKLPTNICEDCDKKLEDMCKFIELVKSTQDNFNHLINTETEKTQDEGENTQRKKVKVTIDLNAITALRLDDENIQEVLGTGQCTDENEVKMKMMQNSEHDNVSDDDNLVIKVENQYDDEHDYKMTEQSDSDDCTDNLPCDVDKNDTEIKSKIEVSPVTISKRSGNVSDEINKCRVSVDISENVLDSNNDGRHIKSADVISNDNTFRDGENRNLDQAITDNGIKVVFNGGNINNAHVSIKDICEESAVIEIKNEVFDIDADNNEEQEVIHYVLNEYDGITIKEENSLLNKDNVTIDEKSEAVITACGMKFSLSMSP